MKTQIVNYSFNKVTKEITFSDLANIRLDKILLVTDVTNNTIIYLFSDQTKGGTVSANVLTLTFNTNTAAFNNTDKLLIFYELDDAKVPTTSSVASSASSVTILAAKANRRGVSVSNQSTSKLYLSFTTPATVANSFVEIPSGAFLILDQSLIITNSIYGIWSSANGTAQVTEYV
jgi:hypothetical protein